MTVSNQTARTSATGTGGASQQIAFSFPVAATSDIKVMSRVDATGVEATLTETTDYTVALTGNGDSGGTVTMVATWAATYSLHVIRDTPMTQALDLVHAGTFSAENQEDAFDKAVKLVIENADRIARALTFPDTDPTSSISDLPSSIDRASKILGFDAAGAPEMNEPTDLTPVPAAGDTKLLSTTTVSFAADGDTTIYTVPAGVRMVIHHLTVIASADAGSAATLACGANGSETDFVPATELSNLDAEYDVVHIYPPAGMVPTQSKSYAAGTVIQVQVASSAGTEGTTNTVYLFGMLYVA